MASETFKKRQKETARREKHKLKIARKLERKNEKARGEGAVDGENLQAPQPVDQPGPTIL